MQALFEISAHEALPWEGDAEIALNWVARRLVELGLAAESSVKERAKKATLNVMVFGERYRLSGLQGDCHAEAMTLRLAKRGSLIDTLLGRAPFDDSDPFARVLQEMLEREAAIVAASVAVVWR